MAKIYLAAPFFDAEEIANVEAMEKTLRELGHTVFSPRENQLEDIEFGSFEWRTNVYRSDVAHLHWCDMVVAIIRRNNDDTGTAFEIGMAHQLGRPILLWNPTGEIINLMITDSIHGYFEDIQDFKNYDFETLPIKPYMKEVK